NIVGAIANEAGVDGQNIRNVTIHDKYATVDLPLGMPRDLFRALKKIWVSGQQLNISRLEERSEAPRRSDSKPGKKKEKRSPSERKKRAKAEEKRSRKRNKPKPSS
ncbi:MAG: DbpA RNA binding domain-containing protein, partial [Gammaproteobacteria bacterium]